MPANEQLQKAFDEFHCASVVLKMRMANAPHSEQTEQQRTKVEVLRARLLKLVFRQVGFDLMPTDPKRASRRKSGTVRLADASSIRRTDAADAG